MQQSATIQEPKDEKKDLLLLYQMMLIRRFEEKAAEQYTKAKIRGFLHLYIGEEAVAVGVIQALTDEDNILSTYLIGPVKVMLDAYANGELSAVYLCYNKFISTMAQQPTIDQLLPLSADKMEAETQAAGSHHGWDYLYEPDAQAVIDDLLVRYAEALVYQAVAENMASEHAARMVAMKAATDNAGNVIGELKLVYNKTRQAAITKELSEIVSGAAAISG